ncbi:hypothetical protein LTR85_001482 [Meristemomyces frigidus]|nr:hypothetical protein LTR85_001482 [Meristemomyces frigidus]
MSSPSESKSGSVPDLEAIPELEAVPDLESVATYPTAAKDAVKRLLNSIKITHVQGGVGHCPVHPKRDECDCPAAFTALTAKDILWAKTYRFLAPFEGNLLIDASAFEYTGDQASHHAFVTAMGTTPKHFLRDYLHRDAFEREFGVAGKQKDTIDALLDLWILRNKQWKATYKDHKSAKDNWVGDEYELPDDCGWSITKEDMDTYFPNMKPGDTFPLHDFTIGPPAHRTTITMLPLFQEESGSTGVRKLLSADARILKRYPCHANCGYSEPCIRESWLGLLSHLVKRYYGAERPDFVRVYTKRVHDVGEDGGGRA